MSSEPFARFFYEAEKDKPASREAGRDVFKQVEFISVTHPGRKDYELVTAATDDHRKRFAKAYEAFKESEKEPEAGTPLKMVPVMTVDTIAELKAAGVKTLEDFASIPRTGENSIQAFSDDVQKVHKDAMVYLEAASDKGALARKFAQSQKENDALKADLEEARETIAELKKENETLQKLIDAPARSAGPARQRKAS